MSKRHIRRGNKSTCNCCGVVKDATIMLHGQCILYLCYDCIDEAAKLLPDTCGHATLKVCPKCLVKEAQADAPQSG